MTNDVSVCTFEVKFVTGAIELNFKNEFGFEPTWAQSFAYKIYRLVSSLLFNIPPVVIYLYKAIWRHNTIGGMLCRRPYPYNYRQAELRVNVER